MSASEATQPLRNAAHIWRFSLVLPHREVTVFNDWLDSRGIALLERMASSDERSRRIVAWGSLRRVLSRYLGCSPGDIQLRREPFGRPELVHPSNAGVQFSLSHSGNLGLVGVATNAIGVDIEKISAAKDVERISRRFYSGDEAERLYGLPDAEKTQEFFRLWVLKEAYLKTVGGGVPSGLSQCSFSLDAQGPRILSSEFECLDSGPTLAEIPVAKGYVAAVAVLQPSVEVSVFDL
ncbi:4'-phosphopantetheinyl transferase family protein [Candidatus Bipolaricaulota bacterium]